MKNLSYISFALFIVTFLQGCAIDTKYHGYHENSPSLKRMLLTKYEGGYEDKKIKENQYEVGYVGYYGSYEDFINLSLLRSSQIALNENKPYFSVLPKKTKVSTLLVNGTRFKTSTKYSAVVFLLDKNQDNKNFTFNSSAICHTLVEIRNSNHDPLPEEIKCGNDISKNLRDSNYDEMLKLYKAKPDGN